MSRRRGNLIGIVVIIGALAVLAAGGIGDNLVYFVTPSELIAKGDAAYGAPFRMAGTVEPGSVDWSPETLDLSFRIRDEENAILVRSEGAPPHMFHGGIQVVVEGSLERDGVFGAYNLLVKHSNEYGPAEDSTGTSSADYGAGSGP